MSHDGKVRCHINGDSSRSSRRRFSPIILGDDGDISHDVNGLKSVTYCLVCSSIEGALKFATGRGI